MILTIDSGGSKTKLTLWDNNKNKILKKTTEGFGIAQDIDQIHPTLFDELTDEFVSLLLQLLSDDSLH